jgi:hypothetical protein
MRHIAVTQASRSAQLLFVSLGSCRLTGEDLGKAQSPAADRQFREDVSMLEQAALIGVGGVRSHLGSRISDSESKKP